MFYKIKLITLNPFYFLFFIIGNKNIIAQNIDLNNTKSNFSKKNLVKLSGGFQSNLITYTGNSTADRKPVAYNVMGNLTIKLFNLIDLPFSFNITNLGNHLSVPTTPNRLALHPKYKSLTAHIGDINMNYSPYTVNGHQFTGGAIDFSGKFPLKVSLLYGRFQRKVEYDTNKLTDPAYQPAYLRMGFGSKLELIKKDYQLGFQLFSATDKINSLANNLDTLTISPQKNTTISVSGSIKPAKGITCKTEYALSAFTQDIRDNNPNISSNILKNIAGSNSSTAYFIARKIGINYSVLKSQIGLEYEKIDPGYKTMGAYFFANDLENIKLLFAKSFLKNKLSLNSSIGFQHDDLDNTKSGTNKRVIGAFNLTIAHSSKLNMNINYSNFQTYLNIKNQFQFINQLNQLQKLDTLNFSQIAQNINVNTMYFLQQSTEQNQFLICNISAQKTTAKQAERVNDAAGMVFVNSSLGYSIGLKKGIINITSLYNYTISKTLQFDNIISGPTLVGTLKLLKKKLTIGLSSSFNKSSFSNPLIPNKSITNIRLTSGLTIKKKHTFVLSFGNQWVNNIYNGLGNLGYNMFF